MWTFAYGANMGSAKLLKLGVEPAQTLPASLPGALVAIGHRAHVYDHFLVQTYQLCKSHHSVCIYLVIYA